jgi:hypothetical protein
MAFKSGITKLLLNALVLPLAFYSQVACVNGATINTDESTSGELTGRAALTLDQSVALKTHNNGRASKNLTLLLWDATLTQHAQTWADYLAKIDNMQHSTSAQRPNEGENLAYAWYVPLFYLVISRDCHLTVLVFQGHQRHQISSDSRFSRMDG